MVTTLNVIEIETVIKGIAQSKFNKNKTCQTGKCMYLKVVKNCEELVEIVYYLYICIFNFT